MSNKLVVVRGAGDLATGIVYTLKNFGYQVIATEIAKPSAIRRTVSLCEAIYESKVCVENVIGVRCNTVAEIKQSLSNGEIPIVVDEDCIIINDLRPDIVVDAIIAKKNLGTTKDMAKIVIGIGPGFCAPNDVHAVVETARGHNIGRVILSGQAKEDTGIPGMIDGYSHERVVYSPVNGIINTFKKIGDHAKANEVIATVEGIEIRSKIDGIIRGIIRDGFAVTQGFKIADVDPRNHFEHCFTISDKARMIGFGTLFAINTFQL